MSNSKVERQINILLYRAEIYIKIIQRLKIFLSQTTPQQLQMGYFLNLVRNDMYFEALSIVCSLFSNDSRETTLSKLDLDKNMLKALREEFEKSNLKGIRNTVGDHKDKDTNTDHSDHIFSQVTENNILQLQSILVGIRAILSKMEPHYELRNPFELTYRGLEDLLKVIEKGSSSTNP